MECGVGVALYRSHYYCNYYCFIIIKIFIKIRSSQRRKKVPKPPRHPPQGGRCTDISCALRPSQGLPPKAGEGLLHCLVLLLLCSPPPHVTPTSDHPLHSDQPPSTAVVWCGGVVWWCGVLVWCVGVVWCGGVVW